jgi:hypothetical protein
MKMLDSCTVGAQSEYRGSGFRSLVRSVEGALSLMPSAANYAEDKEAAEISRRGQTRPKHFGAIAALPGKTIDGSLSEMEYALDMLKLDGLSVPALLTSRSTRSAQGPAAAAVRHEFEVNVFRRHEK